MGVLQIGALQSTGGIQFTPTCAVQFNPCIRGSSVQCNSTPGQINRRNSIQSREISQRGACMRGQSALFVLATPFPGHVGRNSIIWGDSTHTDRRNSNWSNSITRGKPFQFRDKSIDAAKLITRTRVHGAERLKAASGTIISLIIDLLLN